jgi:hypothetical protein
MFISPFVEYQNPIVKKNPKPANPKLKNFLKVAATTSDGVSLCCFINKETRIQCKNKLGLYPQFCWLHTKLINNLVVKDSQIQNAGKGLFAGDYQFKKGDVIARYGYPSNYISEKDLEKRCKYSEKCIDKSSAYLFCDGLDLTKSHIAKHGEKCWDGLDIRSTIARFSNSAHNSKFKYNSTFDLIKGYPYLVATKNIKPGHEIFTNYGETYTF